MNSDILYFIDDVYEKTNTAISIYSVEGQFLCGREDFGSGIFSQVLEVSLDKEKDLTFFPLAIKNNEFVGVIKGSTLAEKKLAVLFNELAKRFQFKESTVSKEEFCKQLLLGQVNAFQAKSYTTKYNMKEMPAYVMVVSVEKKYIDDVMALLNDYGEDGTDFAVKVEPELLALVKFVEEKQRNFHSPTEYADFLVNSIFEEMKIAVNVCIGGTVPTIYDLSTSYEQALATERMSRLVGAKGQVHSFKEFVFIKLIEDMPKHKLSENFEFLLDSGAKEIFDDAEMVLTAEEFLDNNLNSSETARKLFLHRNTLTYRLEKIERLTGLDIRKFSDAITFRLISIINKLTR